MIPIKRVQLYEHARYNFHEDSKLPFDPNTTYRFPANEKDKRLVENALHRRWHEKGRHWHPWRIHIESLGCRIFQCPEQSPNQEALEKLIVVQDPDYNKYYDGSCTKWIAIPEDLAAKALVLGFFP